MEKMTKEEYQEYKANRASISDIKSEILTTIDILEKNGWRKKKYSKPQLHALLTYQNKLAGVTLCRVKCAILEMEAENVIHIQRYENATNPKVRRKMKYFTII